MAEQYKCPNGHVVERGHKYCPECAAEIDWSSTAATRVNPEAHASSGWGGVKVLAAVLVGLLVILVITSRPPGTDGATGEDGTGVSRQTATPTMTIADLERTSTKGITFEKLARNPDVYARALNPIKLEGEVVQIVEQSQELQLRVNITKADYGWEDDVIVFSDTAPRSRLLEDDVIVFYARPRGMISYETVLGATREVPLLELVAIASTNSK